MAKLCLIDGNSYLYRAYYAIRGLASSDGAPTNAIYGFTNMLLKILKDNRPDYISIVFDAPGPTHRHETYADYKVHRPGMPDDLKVQVPHIKDMVNAFRIHTIEMQGYEADDLIGTIAKKAAAEKTDVLVVTGDKDMCQIVGPKIRLYDSMKDRLTDEKDVMERFGVKPSRFPEIIALMGDASDNIPGAPGIGEKTAVKLLREFGSLDNLMQHHAQIKNAKVRNAIAENMENIKLSRELATIHSEIPLDLTLNDLKSLEPDWERLLDYFRKFEFTSLVRLIPKKDGSGQGKTDYSTVNDITMLKKILKRVRTELAIDTETTSENPMMAELVGLSLSVEPEKAYYIPVKHVYDGAPRQLDKRLVCDEIKDILEDPHVQKIGHNIKYDIIILRKEGVDIHGIGFDTMLASYLLNPNKANHSLSDIAMERLGMNKLSFRDVLGKDRKDFSEVPVEKATEYSGEDAAVTLMLKREMEPEIDEQELFQLLRDMELPLIHVLADMEMAGLKVDSALMASFSKEMATDLAGIEKRIYVLAGSEFNINSPKQLQEILFNTLSLKPIKKTKTGYSTNIEVLEQLSLQHELPKDIIDYRALAKLKNTYVDALPRLVNPETGRLHTSFNQTVTATGRLSSSDPNLQNIPIRGEWGKKIRKAFIADNGNVLLSSDYSQIELRIFAHLSEDEGLTAAFQEDGDIHTRTACELFDVPPEKVDSDMRRSAKTVNFGIVYGISPYGLSQQLRIHPEEARRFIDTYFARHQGVKNYIDRVIQEATGKGYATTLFGRKRAIPELRSTNRNIRQLGERLATNSPIQGSAADIIKLSMIRIRNRLKKEKLASKMILQVHDELLFEVPEKEKQILKELVRHEMEHAVSLRIPLKVDIGIGRNWAEAH